MENSTLANNTTVPDTRKSTDVGFIFYYYGIFLILTLVNFSGNSLILTSIRHRNLRTPGNYFIFSLAASDLLHGIVYTVYNISHMELAGVRIFSMNWLECQIVLLSVLALEMVSANNVVAITSARYLAISSPLDSRWKITHKRCLVAVGITWFLGWSLSLGLYARPRPDHYDGMCRFEDIFSWVNSLTYGGFTYLIPFFIMLVMYIKIARIVRNSMARRMAYLQRRISGERRQSIDLKTELRMARTVGMLFFCFTLAVVPFVIYSMVKNLAAWVPISPYIRGTVRIFINLNTVVNAFIYAGSIQAFKKSFQQDLKKLCCIYKRQEKMKKQNVTDGSKSETVTGSE